MDHTLNASVIGKLNAAYPQAGDWITERAEFIFEQRIKDRKNVAFNKGVNTVLAPLTASFWTSAARGMGQIMDGVAQIFGGASSNRPTTPPYSTGQSWESVGNSIDWAAENYRLAACDFIQANNVPMDIFTETEQEFITGKPAPKTAQAPKPEASL